MVAKSVSYKSFSRRSLWFLTPWERNFVFYKNHRKSPVIPLLISFWTIQRNRMNKIIHSRNILHTACSNRAMWMLITAHRILINGLHKYLYRLLSITEILISMQRSLKGEFPYSSNASTTTTTRCSVKFHTIILITSRYSSKHMQQVAAMFPFATDIKLMLLTLQSNCC